jgi:hypothetical protein
LLRCSWSFTGRVYRGGVTPGPPPTYTAGAPPAL